MPASNAAWLDDAPAPTIAERLVALRTERLALDNGGIKRLGSHAAVLARCAEIDAELRRLEREQDREDDEAFDVRQSVKAAESFGLLALAPPADIFTREFAPKRYVWESYLPAAHCAALIGEGAVGKGMLAIAAMLHVAAGLPFLGKATIAGPVIYFSCEDDAEEVWRRVQKIARAMPETSQALIRKNFRLVDAVGKRMHFVIAQHGVVEVGQVVSHITAYLTSKHPGSVLVVIDTISRINGASENSNETMAVIVDAGEAIAQPTGAAVVLLHHTSKAAAREGIDDLHAGRGGSALGDNARSVLRLMPATDVHCKGLDVARDAIERGDVLRLIQAKNSYGRKADVVWLRRGLDGVLSVFEPATEDAETIRRQRLQQLVQWAAEPDRAPFSKTQIRSRELRAAVWGAGVTEAEAERLYDDLVASGEFVDSDTKANGRVRQILNPATADRLAAMAAELTADFDSDKVLHE